LIKGNPALLKLVPNADAALALSREEVGGFILEHLNAQAEGHYHGEDNFIENLRNYMRMVEETYNREVADLFNLAWRWLIERGYIADDIRQSQPGWYRLTTSGRAIKSHGQLQIPRVPREINPGPAPDFSPLTRSNPLLKHLHVLWEEAALAYSGNAYLSCVIMLGSLLEGVLLAKCLSNDATARASAHAPRDGGQVKAYERWSLNDFIEVADDNQWIHKTRNTFADILRDYRNMVHPFNAHNRGYFVDRGIATICWEVVRAALRDLGVNI